MTQLTLRESRVRAGVWEAMVLAPAGEPPSLELVSGGRVLAGPNLREAKGGWVLSAPLPADALSDGVQAFCLRTVPDGEIVGCLAVQVGEVLAGNLVAEVELLRAELDMLKRAFRAHCLDGGNG